MEQWIEVSVLGETYVPRNHHTSIPSERVTNQYSNQLTNGTIIDIGGVSLLFQNPVQMEATKKVSYLNCAIVPRQSSQ